MTSTNRTQLRNSKVKVVLISSASIGPLFISSLLKREGHVVRRLYQGYKEYLGEPSTPFSPPITEKELKEFNPDVVGFSIDTSVIDKAIEMAKEVKKILPNIFIIFGGPHPTICPDESIEIEPIDAICVGEGEYAMLELCNQLKNRETIKNIQNLWVKYNGEIIKNPQRPYLQDLDSIPLDREGIFYGGIYTGRGCYGQCAFCNIPTLRKVGPSGKYLRKRNIECVLDEVNIVYKSILRRKRIWIGRAILSKIFGKKEFIKRLKKITLILGTIYKDKKMLEPVRFKDDSFLSNRKWFLEFAKQLHKRIPKITYICQARANEIDEEVAYWLKKSGCVIVSIGFETGSDFLRNKVIHKNVTNEQSFTANRLLQEQGIKVWGQWMYGLPEESFFDVLRTFIMSVKLGDFPQIHFTAPLPGTEFYDIAIEKGIIDKDFHADSLYGSTVFHKGKEYLWILLISLIQVLKNVKIPKDYEYMRYLGTLKDWRGKKLGEVIAAEMENVMKNMNELVE